MDERGQLVTAESLARKLLSRPADEVATLQLPFVATAGISASLRLRLHYAANPANLRALPHGRKPVNSKAVVSWDLAQPVVIWFRVTDSLTSADIEDARANLSTVECARSDQFMFERDRRDFVAAHALLRDALSLHGGLPPNHWQFECDAAGKPFLIDHTELQFNIAHTPGLAVCGLSLAGPIGVDVELVDHARDTQGIAEYYFSKLEVSELESCTERSERQLRFAEFWTLKEAFLKAIGLGLSRTLDDFEFDFIGRSTVRFNPPPGLPRIDWQFALFAPVAHFRLAVAVRSSLSLKLTVQEWPADEESEVLIPPLRISA